MKLIINIPEDVYTRLFDNGIQDNEIAVDDVCEMARAIRLGTSLEQKPCDDAISRQVALNAICKICAVETKPSECKYRKGLFGGCKEYEAIKAIPSAEPCDDAISIADANRVHGLKKALEIIDKHIGGEENEE